MPLSLTLRRCLYAAICGVTSLAALACGSDPTGPSTLDPVGAWHLAYTMSGGGITCTDVEVDLWFAPAGSIPANGIGGGRGTCVGGGLNDSGMVMMGSVLDSLSIGGGQISFTTHHTAFRYSGRIVSVDSVEGVVSSDTYFTNVGPVHQVGSWGAHRLALPLSSRQPN